MLAPWKKSYGKPIQNIKRDITLPTKVHLVKAMVFPVVIYGCESWIIKKAGHQKNWCFWTVVLEKNLESPLDCKDKPVHPKGNQSWIFTERSDVEAETPILWPPDGKSRFIRKDSDAGKDWRPEKKGMPEDKMVGWHHRSTDIILTKLRRWWRTGMPGVLQSLGSHRVGNDWETVFIVQKFVTTLWRRLNSSRFIDINTETQEGWVILPRSQGGKQQYLNLSIIIYSPYQGSPWFSGRGQSIHMCETTKRPSENSVTECNVCTRERESPKWCLEEGGSPLVEVGFEPDFVESDKLVSMGPPWATGQHWFNWSNGACISKLFIPVFLNWRRFFVSGDILTMSREIFYFYCWRRDLCVWHLVGRG